MTKSDIITKVAKETGVSKTDARLVIDHYMESIKEALQEGEKVYLRKFGTFLRRQRIARSSHDVKSKKKIIILPRTVPIFKASKLFFQELKEDKANAKMG